MRGSRTEYLFPGHVGIPGLALAKNYSVAIVVTVVVVVLKFGNHTIEFGNRESVNRLAFSFERSPRLRDNADQSVSKS